MSYEKHTWQTGEVITAEKLNKIEEGIKSPIFVCNAITETNGDYNLMCDKSSVEIKEAFDAGLVCVLCVDGLTNAGISTKTCAYLHKIITYTADNDLVVTVVFYDLLGNVFTVFDDNGIIQELPAIEDTK